MVGSESNTKKPQLIHDASSFYYLHPSENSGMSLTKYLLTGKNYDVWSKAIINALEGRNKAGFINGDFGKPEDDKSPEFAAWKANNSTICSWLFNSVAESIQPIVVSLKIAIEMWVDLKERYSTVNGPRINQLKSQYHLLRQKGMNIVSYYNKFKELWDLIYGSEDVTCGCTCAAAPKLRARAETEKILDFVMGFDDEQYGPLRTQILSMDPFPTLNKAFSLATQEERHKDIIRARDDKTDAMSFAVQAATHTPSKQSIPPAITPMVCTHCGRQGHEVQFCYQLHGYPSNSRGRGRGRGSGRGRGGGQAGRGLGSSSNAVAHNAMSSTPRRGDNNNSSSSTAASVTSLPGLNAEQMQRLLTLLDTSSTNDKLNGPHYEDGYWSVGSLGMGCMCFGLLLRRLARISAHWMILCSCISVLVILLAKLYHLFLVLVVVARLKRPWIIVMYVLRPNKLILYFL
ncbi:uncharacterized protein LOC110702054 [Chenopodium quinoa]|uniref:uncharacterized protein LOC110702054 n=1 Tax=Chenopodium quinoa TaxID=63459 RepID=UPI000B794FD3|nr:uncharacterized protein LOC110702054 [Chenopodium quinoa]